MELGTLNHLKLKRLKRRLGIPLFQVVGILETLWHIAAESAEAGDIGRFSDEEIAMGLEWQGDAGELIAALVETRWLDTDTERRLVVHDWNEHAPDAIKARLRKPRPPAVAVCDPMLASHQSDRSQLDEWALSIGGTAEAGDAAYLSSYEGPFEEWWSVYPRRVKKVEACRQYQSAIAYLVHSQGLTDAQAQDWLLTVTMEFASSPAAEEPGPDQPDYRPGADVWLKDRRFEDDRSQWARAANAAQAKATKRPRARPVVELNRPAGIS